MSVHGAQRAEQGPALFNLNTHTHTHIHVVYVHGGGRAAFERGVERALCGRRKWFIFYF